MPILRSRFRPPAFLRDGHVQTILPAILPRRYRSEFERERLELGDGDFVDLDWCRAGHGRVAVLSHGLEGASRQGYIRGMADALQQAGWDVLAWNFRGCSGEPNRHLRFYHSGETADLGAVVEHAAAAYPVVALVGFSLGGNVTLKYLGEGRMPGVVRAAAVVSVPLDLASSAHCLDHRWANRIYLLRFLRTMRMKIAAKSRQFPGRLDVAGLEAVASFREFDGRYTAPLHGFADAEDYWARCSARPLLPEIRIPTLVLNAANDPFLAPECFPVKEAAANPALYLEVPESGGHVGFLDLADGIRPWSEGRVAGFFEEVLAGGKDGK